MLDTYHISTTALHHYPDIQAIYLFGSYANGGTWADSDVDIALLLPHDAAKQLGSLAMADLRFELEEQVGTVVDLINLRQVSTVFQKEIICTGQRIFTLNEWVADEFEMLTLSFYQKLNQERHDILVAFQKTGRAYAIKPN